jgi:hypothetical protein
MRTLGKGRPYPPELPRTGLHRPRAALLVKPFQGTGLAELAPSQGAHPAMRAAESNPLRGADPTLYFRLLHGH